jgi:Tat protein secretion system quality control protein TatD with DNase activity
MGIQELLARRPRPAQKQEINLVGGMLVYCDPKTWPKDPERLNLPEGWFIAVGVHPKHAMDFGDYYFDRLSKLLDSPAVTALGEVGIDCSEGAKPFGIQRSTLKWVLALARPYMPLVFHIRASGDNPQAMDTLCREVLGLTHDKVPNTLQNIHLHCFNGDEATVKLWSDAYPGTYFGFSSMVKGFGDRQRRGSKQSQETGSSWCLTLLISPMWPIPSTTRIICSGWRRRSLG